MDDGRMNLIPNATGKLLQTFELVNDMNRKSSWLPLHQEWAWRVGNQSCPMPEFN